MENAQKSPDGNDLEISKVATTSDNEDYSSIQPEVDTSESITREESNRKTDLEPPDRPDDSKCTTIEVEECDIEEGEKFASEDDVASDVLDLELQTTLPAEEPAPKISSTCPDNHPYKHILLSFEPTVEQLGESKLAAPKSLQETFLCEINKKEDLEDAIKDLKQQTEIGVDVEWSDHGYKAVTCLVQVSTKDKDYIIDAISLKEHMILLNEIFIDPNIVKIFHAAFNDFKWLQQDFDLFVINMFDSQLAMRALGYKRLGLDAVLENYNVRKDKTLQRVDFRKRPLPPQYKDYARTDSHFLIHIYHTLKNELIQAKLLTRVLEECNNTCKVVYEKIDDLAYVSIREKLVKMHERQLLGLDKLNSWRHRIAEYVDVNPGYVLSKNSMNELILRMPHDPNTILKISKSKFVAKHLQEIVNIMWEAKSGQHALDVNAGLNRFGKNKFNKRKLDQTDFNKSDPAPTPKNRQLDFDLRNTLQAGDRFKRNRNKRRFHR